MECRDDKFFFNKKFGPEKWRSSWWPIFDLDFKVVLMQIGYNKDLYVEFDFQSLKELRNYYRKLFLYPP